MKTRILTNRIKYRFGSYFAVIIVDGKRYNIPLETLRGQKPLISKDAEELYELATFSWDKHNFSYSDCGEDVQKECLALNRWYSITPATIKNFVYANGLLK